MRIPIEWLREYVNIDKSAKEIADTFTQLGLLLDKPIKNNVLDLEHRMDRADWLGIIGCARDLAAFEKLKLKIPEGYEENVPTVSTKDNIDVKVEDKDFVNRFYTYVFRDITVKNSPAWLKNRLEAYGIPSINNIVDITNYVMVEMGQPLHAHDIDKMEKPEIVFRKAKKGEKITTLLGEEVKLDENTFITSSNGKPTGVGGIVGGNMLKVDKKTKNIVLDSGNYIQNIIRKTSRRLKIQNETVLRDDKFLSPIANELAVKRATKLILEIAGGKVYKNGDYYPKKVRPQKMTLRMGRISKLGGIEFSKKDVVDVLERLGYEILKNTADLITVEIPYFRTDVTVEDDLVADILRMYDYSKIPISLLSTAPPKEITPEIYNFEDKIRDILVASGLHEHITDPLVSDGQIKLTNTLSSEKSALRTQVRDTLKVVGKTYRKHKIKNVGVFEIGLNYSMRGDPNKYKSYLETRVVEVLCGNPRQILATLLQNLGIQKYILTPNAVKIGNITIGKLDLGGFYLETEKLLGCSKLPERVVTEIKHYTTEDISLIVEKDTHFGPVLEDILRESGIIDAEVVEEHTGRGVVKGKRAVLVKVTYNTSKTKLIREKLIKKLVRKHKLVYRA
ncbi:phenylalanine--tRNA ligase beta subunit-related protein [Patescibacteria group bacterium]